MKLLQHVSVYKETIITEPLPELSVCAVQCVSVYAHTQHSTHALQVIICSHNTDNVLYDLYVSSLNQVCNLTKYWQWLPDDRFLVNRDMLESFINFLI
jgi:hypothetical protein